MLDGGQSAVVLSDRGRLLDLKLDRNADGAIAGAQITQLRGVRKVSKDNPVRDTEGLAITPDGRIFISFEGPSQVAEFQQPRERPVSLPAAAAFEVLKVNRGLEALAIASDGALWTVAERRTNGQFPIFIWTGTTWIDGPRIDSDGLAFVPVGLDFDDVGRLYLLERQFLGPFGFRNRLRRFTLDGARVTGVETLIESGAGQHDNLEGVAVWRDAAQRLIVTMISDDNFFALQKTEIVEYLLPD